MKILNMFSCLMTLLFMLKGLHIIPSIKLFKEKKGREWYRGERFGGEQISSCFHILHIKVLQYQVVQPKVPQNITY
jgi:hypothetical protein